MAPTPSPSQDTKSSLFHRIRAQDEGAWREFECRYREMMVRFCRRRGLQLFDAEDVVQRVLSDLVRTLPQFVYDQERGRFRDYLHQCVRNAIGHWAKHTDRQPHQLRSGAVSSLEADSRNGWDCPDDQAGWEEEWVAHHYRLAMCTIRTTFEPRSVQIFDRSIAGDSIVLLAEAFSMSQEAVRKARERIRDRMEELIAGQIREEDDFGDGNNSAPDNGA